MKTTSCGILVCNPARELLMCHATGTAYWDIPKGAGESGESMQQTALRETAEECGLAFDADAVLELGRFRYRPAKDLQLYAVLVEPVDAKRCHCSTTFRDRFGREQPEMDDFAWVPFSAVTTRCAKSMAALLAHALPLDEVLARLHAAGRMATPRWLNVTVRD
jgi:8-oxo-dGTP pyrophosphatase MutT (NUDIX family)